jgi:hypothetical protein
MYMSALWQENLFFTTTTTQFGSGKLPGVRTESQVSLRWTERLGGSLGNTAIAEMN